MALGKKAKWLYQEFGVSSVVSSGRDTWLVILMRTCRMFAFGAVSLVFALFLSALGYSDVWIGFFLTATMAGEVVISLGISLIADQVGRRRVLFCGAALMVASGMIFIVFENYWLLLLAATIGVISATGGDYGPFRSIEESTLSHLTTASTRADVLSWYVTSASLGSAIGTEISGRIVKALKDTDAKSVKDVYHAMFWVYVVAGVISMVSSSLISKRAELEQKKTTESEVAVELAEPLLDEDEDEEEEHSQPNEPQKPIASSQPKSWFAQMVDNARLSGMSTETKSAVVKLWVLLTVDSLADGMVSYGLTIYYLARKFDVSESYLGDVMSICYILMAISTIFASPLARRLGLVNTMVFTHIPSSAAVLLFPIPQSLPLTVVLLFIRTGLNNMDQGPRAALIAAIVKPDKRTAVMGITSMLRTLAGTLGPSITGLLSSSNKFWVAYVLAGVLRLVYDFGLWYLFTGVNTSADEEDEDDRQ